MASASTLPSRPSGANSPHSSPPTEKQVTERVNSPVEKPTTSPQITPMSVPARLPAPAAAISSSTEAATRPSDTPAALILHRPIKHSAAATANEAVRVRSRGVLRSGSSRARPLCRKTAAAPAISREVIHSSTSYTSGWRYAPGRMTAAVKPISTPMTFCQGRALWVMTASSWRSPTASSAASGYCQAAGGAAISR